MRMIQRDDMGWEVGGGFRIGNSCTPVADSCQVWQNQYSIVKQNKVKIKIKKKERNRQYPNIVKNAEELKPSYTAGRSTHK